MLEVLSFCEWESKQRFAHSLLFRWGSYVIRALSATVKRATQKNATCFAKFLQTSWIAKLRAFYQPRLTTNQVARFSYLVVKRAPSLFNSICGKVAKQVALRFTVHKGADTSKVQVTFHRSRVKITASLINYHTTQIPLDLTEHFVKRLGLGDTFNAIHLSVSWWPVLWPVEKWPVL